MNIRVIDSLKLPRYILRLITLVAIVGSAILLLNNSGSRSSLAYELLLYGISISALTLTTLQSLAIAQQIRLTRRSSGKMTETVNKLEELAAADRKLTRIVMHDDAIVGLIARALAKNKVGKNKDERLKIAKSVHRHLLDS